ncbi:hypothetical protein HAX54_002574 [Datura stramonium]|uniref:Uncharacterized protein n=1 Tax=Datura stramonium TaxID=4076 RepID=A0ABS8T5D8_DATST|nr:hypothetical protein [Datura stramonium]
MTSRVDKGKEVAVSSKGLKPLRKGVASSLSVQKVPPARRFGVKAMEEHGLKWFNAYKEEKCAPENWIEEGRLVLDFPTIRDTIQELGRGYVFAEQEECNLTLLPGGQEVKMALIRHSHSLT